MACLHAIRYGRLVDSAKLCSIGNLSQSHFSIGLTSILNRRRNTMATTAEVLTPLSHEDLRKMDAYWRACNYLSAGMIYLRANPLLREPLKPEHIKNRL